MYIAELSRVYGRVALLSQILISGHEASFLACDGKVGCHNDVL